MNEHATRDGWIALGSEADGDVVLRLRHGAEKTAPVRLSPVQALSLATALRFACERPAAIAWLHSYREKMREIVAADKPNALDGANRCKAMDMSDTRGRAHQNDCACEACGELPPSTQGGKS